MVMVQLSFDVSISALKAHALPLLPLIMLGMAAVDPGLHPDQLVTSKGERLLRAARNGCVASVFAVAATIPVADVFKPGASLTRLDSDMAPNEPGTLDPPAPLLVAQGTADQIIDPARTVTMVSALCANGATVKFRTYPGVDHFGEIAASLPDVQAWAAGRLAGRQPPSTCQPIGSPCEYPSGDCQLLRPDTGVCYRFAGSLAA